MSFDKLDAWFLPNASCDIMRPGGMLNATISPWSPRVDGLPAGTVLASGLAMIRSELVARIAEQNPHLCSREIEEVVDAVLGRIAKALSCGDRVELREFGTFSVRSRDARAGRNPKTGAVVTVEAKTGVHFKPAKAMRERLNRSRVDPAPEVEVQRLLRTA